MLEKTTKWYLYVDARANESLADELAQAGIVEESRTEIEVEGKKIPVWEVPYRFVNRMERNRKTLMFEFTTFVREGGGEPRPWNLQGRGKLARQKEVRRVRNETRRRRMHKKK